VGPGRAWVSRRLRCATCRGSPAKNGTGLWGCYAEPANLITSIVDQNRMLAPVRDLLSEAKLLYSSYAEGGIARESLCGSAR
jgi:hypothetical protein